MARAAAVTIPLIPRVNLLPKIELDRRARAVLIRKWLTGMLLALIVAMVAVAGAGYLRWTADQALQAENARTQTLITDLAALSGVSSLVDAESSLTAFRADAMVDEIGWVDFAERIGPAIEAVVPVGTVVSGFDLAPGGAGAGDDPAIETGLVGTLVVTSAAPIDIAPMAAALADVDGVLSADAQQLTLESGADEDATVYTNIITLRLDQTWYTGRFAQEGAGE